MDYFDRLLEYHLRRKLDPVVAAPVPPRRGRVNSSKSGLLGRPNSEGRAEPAPRRLGAMPLELRPDALVFVERS